MSSLAYDHHSFCSFCRDFECTHDNRCEKCLLISDVQFAAYFKHQKSLKRKLRMLILIVIALEFLQF